LSGRHIERIATLYRIGNVSLKGEVVHLQKCIGVSNIDAAI